MEFILLAIGLFNIFLLPFGAAMNYAEHKDEERKANRKEDNNA